MAIVVQEGAYEQDGIKLEVKASRRLLVFAELTVEAGGKKTAFAVNENGYVVDPGRLAQASEQFKEQGVDTSKPIAVPKPPELAAVEEQEAEATEDDRKKKRWT